MLYCAYGSNMSINQMAWRCPNAVVVGTGYIPNYLLMFRGKHDSAYATVQPDYTSERGKGKGVPVVIWEISKEDEEVLDLYEGYPNVYLKGKIKVDMNDGKNVEAMFYIMKNGQDVGMPTGSYFNTVLEGYQDNGIDSEYLFKRLEAVSNMLIVR